MDSIKPIIATADPTANAVEKMKAAGKVGEDKTEQLAKDFESVLTYRLLMEMNNTIGQWGMEKEQTEGQVQSLFSLYLSQHISENGGLGLWKEIKKSLDEMVGKGDRPDGVEMNI